MEELLEILKSLKGKGVKGEQVIRFHDLYMMIEQSIKLKDAKEEI